MATSTITNTIAGGGAGIIVRARLKTRPSSIYPEFSSTDSSEIETLLSTTTDSGGSWSLELERQADIVPSTTFWEIEEIRPLAIGGRTVSQISVGAFDATLLASLITPSTSVLSNYLTQAVADARYTSATDTRAANRVYAGPTTGSAAAPTFRALVAADLPVGTGTVTSVALTVPSILSVAGSPITTSGTFAVTLATQTANTIFAGPTTGAAAAPTFRALVAADIPSTLGATAFSGAISASSGNLSITAGANDVQINGADVSLRTGGTERFVILSTGHIVAGVDNTYDLGASGATRPRTGYFGTSVVVPMLNATTAIQLAGASINTAGTLSNVAYLNQTNAFTAIQSVTHGASGSVGLDIKSTNSHATIGFAANNGARTVIIGADKAGTLAPGSADGDFVFFMASKDAYWTLDSGSTAHMKLTTAALTLAVKVLTSASTTARAGLNLPHGAAPTSPVDGDVWTTTAGLFVRVNGATVGPLS